MRSQILIALTLGECFDRQQRHSGFIKPVYACRHARRCLPPKPVYVLTPSPASPDAAKPGESTASGRCRPVAREETFYEIEADVPIVAAG